MNRGYRKSNDKNYATSHSYCNVEHLGFVHWWDRWIYVCASWKRWNNLLWYNYTDKSSNEVSKYSKLMSKPFKIQVFATTHGIIRDHQCCGSAKVSGQFQASFDFLAVKHSIFIWKCYWRIISNHMMILLYINEGCHQVRSSSVKLKQNFSFTMHFTSISFKCKAAKYRLKVVMTPGLSSEFSIGFFTLDYT